MPETEPKYFSDFVEFIKMSFKNIDNHFEKIEKRFEQVDRRFEQMDRRFEQVDRRFEKMERRLDGHTEQIAKVSIDTRVIRGLIGQKADQVDLERIKDHF